jgi:hypothetical protein
VSNENLFWRVEASYRRLELNTTSEDRRCGADTTGESSPAHLSRTAGAKSVRIGLSVESRRASVCRRCVRRYGWTQNPSGPIWALDLPQRQSKAHATVEPSARRTAETNSSLRRGLARCVVGPRYVRSFGLLRVRYDSMPNAEADCDRGVVLHYRTRQESEARPDSMQEAVPTCPITPDDPQEPDSAAWAFIPAVRRLRRRRQRHAH